MYLLVFVLCIVTTRSVGIPWQPAQQETIEKGWADVKEGAVG